ncbi:carbohydrate ABC transporter permease [Treponema brennaborense]|uniref:ABC-type transporter, integral membrane subunit n=1 Tax=Treponema brennaborense (strain DSM 12168 / CIP 105900 / DD5/3) TaxID=906968 RepID=F4LNL3_TREBD|nr:sugar ABC transporter permease [Treponema brennaborense]AEE15867.1 ABC-type transporter, integral membrane subunit [Treponema brennaborense DSM 12168]
MIVSLHRREPARFFKVAAVLPITVFIAAGGFLFLRAGMLPQVPTTIFAVVWGTSSVLLVFYSLNLLTQLLSVKAYNAVVPFVFIGPAVLIMSWYLLIPTLRTFYLSFMDKSSTGFAGLSNYVYVFTDATMLSALRNTVLWLVCGTFFSVLLGLSAAILADRSAIEKLGKTLVFLPMAISLVGAGVIWKFIYAYRPAADEQIGLLNALVVFFGGEPRNWLGTAPANNAFLIAIFVWLQTGFALVVLSAALKAVPVDMIEAARIDGAGEWSVLTRIVVPSIAGSIVTVATTILLAALKCFDIVFSMTNGLYGTEVLASQQYKQMFKFLHYGRGSAIAVLILIAVSPVIWYNLKEFGKREVF